MHNPAVYKCIQACVYSSVVILDWLALINDRKLIFFVSDPFVFPVFLKMSFFFSCSLVCL